MVSAHTCFKVAGDKGISTTKSKQQSPCSNCMHHPMTSWGNACSTCMHKPQKSPCSNCMHQPMTSWGNACSTCMHKPVRCMHWPVTSQVDACTYCMGFKVSSLPRIYLYSSYFVLSYNHILFNLFHTGLMMHLISVY